MANKYRFEKPDGSSFEVEFGEEEDKRLAREAKAKGISVEKHVMSVLRKRMKEEVEYIYKTDN